MKVILKDKTEVVVSAMPFVGAISTTVKDVAALQALKDKLTTENLAEVKTTNDADLVVGTYENQVLIDTWAITWEDDGIYVTFGFRDKTDIEELNEKFEAAQAVQDGAIADLGTAVSALAEGGTK